MRGVRRRRTTPRQSRLCGSAGMITASGSCWRARPRGARKASSSRPRRSSPRWPSLAALTDGSTWRASTRERAAFPTPWRRSRRRPTTKSPRRPGSSTGSPVRSMRSNGLLDDAIANFEAVLATKIPDRKFDFSTDYRVINDLAATLLRTCPDRAAGHEPPPGLSSCKRRSPPITKRWRSIPKTSRPTGAWPRPMATPDGGDVRVPRFPRTAPPQAAIKRPRPPTPIHCGVSPPRSPTVICQPLNANRGRSSWLVASRDSWTAQGRATSRDSNHCTTLPACSAKPGRPKVIPKRWQPWRRCSRSRTGDFTSGSSPMKQPRAAHSRLARQKDPAANMNAQSIVIHPLHRTGAPGIDPPVTAKNPVTAKTPVTAKPPASTAKPITAAVATTPAPEYRK